MSEYAPFKIGEVVVGYGFNHDTECNGMECEIIGGLEKREWYNDRGNEGCEMMYEVIWADGEICFQRHSNLRRLPPKDDPTTWEQVEELTGWTPGRVEA